MQTSFACKAVLSLPGPATFWPHHSEFSVIAKHLGRKKKYEEKFSVFLDFLSRSQRKSVNAYEVETKRLFYFLHLLLFCFFFKSLLPIFPLSKITIEAGCGGSRL